MRTTAVRVDQRRRNIALLRRSEHQVPTKRGHVGVYLGDCTLDDVLIARDRFGAVTLQGRRGLKHLKTLRRMGRSIDGIDIDPATYGKRPAPVRTDRLTLEGMEVSESDWITDQRELELRTIRTESQRVRVGRLDELRRALEVDAPDDVTVTLALDGGWLGRRHIADLEQQLKLVRRDVALVLGAVFDPVESVDRVASLRRLVSWAAAEHLRLELLRTDLVGLPAVLDGLAYAAVGLTTSTRHFGIPMRNNSKEYQRRQHSPLVFVPELMHWLRATRIGALAAWDGGGITDCDCTICAVEGSLLRFDEDFSSANEAKATAAPHNREALGRLVGEVLASEDPAAELGRRRDDAIQLAREFKNRQRVEISLPPWIESWS